MLWATETTVTPAHAERVRRRFDPEDLQLEEPGVIHADVAWGLVRGETAGRWLLPDFDIDVGVAPNVELGLDGSWSLEGTPAHLFARDHAAPDNLWLSSKMGLWGTGHKASEGGWAFGIQMGPRIPVAPDTHGAGFQGVLLLGWSLPRVHVVLNGGGLIDPGGAVSSQRPIAALTGVDAEIALDHQDRWVVDIDLSSVFFASQGKHQLVMTAGPTCSVTRWLDLGVSGLIGILRGGDRFGGFLTVEPKVQLF